LSALDRPTREEGKFENEHDTYNNICVCGGLVVSLEIHLTSE